MAIKYVEKHILKKNKTIDDLSFKSKNLYNQANYAIRQEFIKNKKWLRYHQIDKLAKQEKWESYSDLPAQTAQQILKILDQNWKSFFSTIKSWAKDKTKFKGRPKLPKYKDKVKGRNIVVFTGQQAKIKDGFIFFPKKAWIEPIKTKVNNICQVRIVPAADCYVLEVIYQLEKEEIKDLDKNNCMGIDIGLSNVAAITYNRPGLQPLLVNGRALKSINQYYNKKRAKLMSYVGNKGTSKKLKILSRKRNNKIDNALHHISKRIVDDCLQKKIGLIVIGKNNEWKQNIDLGKVNNQNFVQIPFAKLIDKIKYKADFFGITVIIQEESYTSKCSFFDNEKICKHDSYLGTRVKRGIFKTSTGKKVNADVNGSLNIIRKAFPDIFVDGIEGLGLNPVRKNFF